MLGRWGHEVAGGIRTAIVLSFSHLILDANFLPIISTLFLFFFTLYGKKRKSGFKSINQTTPILTAKNNCILKSNLMIDLIFIPFLTFHSISILVSYTSTNYNIKRGLRLFLFFFFFIFNLNFSSYIFFFKFIFLRGKKSLPTFRWASWKQSTQ